MCEVHQVLRSWPNAYGVRCTINSILLFGLSWQLKVRTFIVPGQAQVNIQPLTILKIILPLRS